MICGVPGFLRRKALSSPKLKSFTRFFSCEGCPPPVCLRCSPGLFRHACGVTSCHTSSMPAKPHLGLTQNSSPTTLANGRRAAQIAESRGIASGRWPQPAKFPPAAAGETPAPRTARNPPSSQSAIRRWRNPRPRAMVRAATPAGWTAWTIHQRRTGYRPPTHRAQCAPCCAAGASPRPTGSEHIGLSGFRRNGPNVSWRAVQSIVGRGIPDAPTPHPIRGRQGCRPLRRFWSAVQHGGGTHRSRPTFSVGSLSVLSGSKFVPASLRQWYYGTFCYFLRSFPSIPSQSKKYFSFFPSSWLFLVQSAQIPLFSGCHIVTLPFLL